METELDLKVYDILHSFVLDVRELVFLGRAFFNGITSFEQITRTEKRSQMFRTEGRIAM